MLKIGIIGATGYTGEELIKILLRHPYVKISYLAAKIDKPSCISDIFPYFQRKIDLVCDNLDVEKALALCDIFFLAVPHTVSMQITPKLLKDNRRVIDLSADYRLKSTSLYKKWYLEDHKDITGIEKAVYGLPEFYKDKIKRAKLVANPGCYPTAAILALAPLLKSKFYKTDFIIIDAKSGVTGAGRKASLSFFYSELNENLKAYKINQHQHIPEIEQWLSNITGKKIKINFIPHLIPMNRGILETIYVKISYHPPSPNASVDVRRSFNGGGQFPVTSNQLISLYKKFYKKEPFVRIRKEGSFPEIKDVVGTNYCDIGIKFDEEKKLLIIVSVIDNLMKGAAAQAVQNMNIMSGFKETEALL